MGDIGRGRLRWRLRVGVAAGAWMLACTAGQDDACEPVKLPTAAATTIAESGGHTLGGEAMDCGASPFCLEGFRAPVLPDANDVAVAAGGSPRVVVAAGPWYVGCGGEVVSYAVDVDGLHDPIRTGVDLAARSIDFAAEGQLVIGEGSSGPGTGRLATLDPAGGLQEGPADSLMFVDVVSVDIDGVAPTDLVASWVGVGDDAEPGQSGTMIFLGQPDGTFERGPDLSPASRDEEPQGVAAGDVDGDGNPDVVVAVSGELFVHRGSGSDLGAAELVGDGRWPHLVDLDGDGRSAIVAELRTGAEASVAVFREDGGMFPPPDEFPALGAELRFGHADLDADGDSDLAVISTADGDETLLVFPNLDGALQPPVRFDLPTSPDAIAAGPVGPAGADALVVLSSDEHDGIVQVMWSR